jgi:hypothetical protein
MTLAGETKPWITNLAGRVLGLEVILLKQVIVLPWNQFLYAEGGDDEVRAVFTTHDVVAKGSGLASLPGHEGERAVDHIIARQHDGATTIDNLALACLHCNRHKGPNIAGRDVATGDLVRLFHPRQH